MAFMLSTLRDPELNFDKLWETFQNRYPFFGLRNVDWKKQYDIYRPKVTQLTTDDELFALAMKQLPHVTLIGDDTNGIFSYQLEKKLPNGWRYRLSYQIYFSADMVCYEGRGVPVDIRLLNRKCDIDNGEDPLITRALEVIEAS